jgi:transcription elongation GreA/GreB family factor
MSRAFVNEDHFVEDLPDRPVSQHPNLVTARGLALIDAALDDARRWYGEAQAAEDRAALARAARDLRYWSARRASAQVVPMMPDRDSVQFGSAVTLVREDGRRQTFRIVGEDEADPSKGSISHVSPLAKALLGKRVGDSVRAGRDDAEITAIADL